MRHRRHEGCVVRLEAGLGLGLGGGCFSCARVGELEVAVRFK